MQLMTLQNVINCRFPTTETNSRALYISWFSPPHQKLFFVTVQIFVKSADFCLQLCFSERWKKASRNLSHFKKGLHIENECKFQKRTSHWKWMQILKKNYVLKMNAHLKKELHFENVFGKVKSNYSFLKKAAISK